MGKTGPWMLTGRGFLSRWGELLEKGNRTTRGVLGRGQEKEGVGDALASWSLGQVWPVTCGPSAPHGVQGLAWCQGREQAPKPPIHNYLFTFRL